METATVVEEKEKAVSVPQRGEFDVGNIDIVQTANFLGLNYYDLTNKMVAEKLERIWDYYQEDKPKESFFRYIRDLNSKLGYRAGIHPLDKIYTFITLTEDRKKQEQEKREREQERRERKKLEEARIARERRNFQQEKIKLEREKEELLRREQLKMRRIKSYQKAKEEAFRKKIELIRNLFKEI